MTDAAGRVAVARFATLPARERFHVWLRWRSCPMERVAATFPARGHILEVGCGHGLFSQFLVAAAPGRHVTGVDIDPHKIALAQMAAAGQERLDFHVMASGDLPDGPFDAIAIVDVLYLLAPDERDALLGAAAARLAAGGALVVKEVGTQPAWKARLAGGQERLSTSVLRITAGRHRGFESGDALAARLAQCGLTTTVTPLDDGRLHPHVLVVGQSPHTGSQGQVLR
jgi:2-polyprenyl-3-methyl-5-hydroxy-6-metoxy-1,4-benzoquinol methylase